MSMTPPELACPAALAANRARVRADDDLFLHALAARELHLRLSEVNRTFTAPAVVTGLPQVWGDFLPHARVVADSPVLDLAAGAHDLVIHAMALHWAGDPVGQMVQARRALRPDGLFLAVCFGGQTLSELRAALATAEVELTGGLSPRVLPMAEIRDWGGLLQRAGLALPVADTLVQEVGYRDVSRLYADLRAMGERNALATRRRQPPPPALFRRTAQIYARHHSDAQGHLRATFELIFLTGWAPDAGQPQPLRPGSARTRLADALGVPETPLGDAVNSGRLD
jgi:SAM-dependent methyltransferase